MATPGTFCVLGAQNQRRRVRAPTSGRVKCLFLLHGDGGNLAERQRYCACRMCMIRGV